MLIDDDVLIRNRQVVAAPLHALDRTANGFKPKPGLFDHITRVRTIVGNERSSGFSYSVEVHRLNFQSICRHCGGAMAICSGFRQTPQFCSETCIKRGDTRQRSFIHNCANCGQTFSSANSRARACSNECRKAMAIVQRESARRW